MLRRVYYAFTTTGAGSHNYSADFVAGSAVGEGTGAGGGGTIAVGAGGGAAWAKKVLTSAVAGGTVNLVVGAGAANTNGGDSTINSTELVAAGGKSGTNGGLGGLASDSTGDSKQSGGNGHLSAVDVCGSGGAGGEGGDGTNGASATAGNGGGKTGARGTATATTGHAPGGGGRGTSTNSREGGRGVIRIYYDITQTDLTYPRLRDVVTGRTSSNSTSLSATLPAVTTNRRVTVIVGSDGNPTLSTAASGWTKVGQGSATDNSCTIAVFTKFCTTNEGTLAITSSNTEQFSTHAYADEDAAAPEATFGTTATGANPDPGTHTPSGGSAPYLLRTAIAFDAVTTGVDMSAPPSGYGDFFYNGAQTAGGCALASAGRYATVSSENPGTWTTTDQGAGATVTLSYANLAGYEGLTGSDFSPATGTLTPKCRAALAGSDASAAQGSITKANHKPSLSGSDFAAAEGSVSDHIRKALTGSDFSAAAGTLTAEHTSGELVGEDFDPITGEFDPITGASLLEAAVQEVCDHEYVARGILKFAPPFWGKPRVAAILLSVLEEIQELECAVNQVIVGRYLDLAYGHTLNRLGKLLGRPNQGWGESLYKRFIRAQIEVNNSKGGINRVLRILKALWPDYPRKVYWLNDANVAGEVIGLETTTYPLELLLPGQVVSGGVRLDLWMLPTDGLRGDHVGGTIDGAGVAGHVGDDEIGDPVWHVERTN